MKANKQGKIFIIMAFHNEMLVEMENSLKLTQLAEKSLTNIEG